MFLLWIHSASGIALEIELRGKSRYRSHLFVVGGLLADEAEQARTEEEDWLLTDSLKKQTNDNNSTVPAQADRRIGKPTAPVWSEEAYIALSFWPKDRAVDKSRHITSSRVRRSFSNQLLSFLRSEALFSFTGSSILISRCVRSYLISRCVRSYLTSSLFTRCAGDFYYKYSLMR